MLQSLEILDFERKIVDNIWDYEPDLLKWRDRETGLVCTIARMEGRSGHLCGYVSVPEIHPAFGKKVWGFGEESEYDQIQLRVFGLDVHGGITYSEKGLPRAIHDRIGEVWTFGFDCAHAGDLRPEWPEDGGTYRHLEYVKAEVESLARQLAEME